MTTPPTLHELRPPATRLYVTRLSRGEDLLLALKGLADTHGIRSGLVQGIGALDRAVVGFYDRDARAYQEIRLDQPLEVLSLLGNISLAEGRSLVHAHVVLGDREGRTWGGHLLEGSVVFAFELSLTEFVHEWIERVRDEDTGLLLWP
jgi:hypothetical protein